MFGLFTIPRVTKPCSFSLLTTFLAPGGSGKGKFRLLRDAEVPPSPWKTYCLSGETYYFLLGDLRVVGEPSIV